MTNPQMSTIPTAGLVPQDSSQGGGSTTTPPSSSQDTFHPPDNTWVEGGRVTSMTDRQIWAKLIIAEVIGGTGGFGLTPLVAFYNAFGADAAYNKLADYIGVVFPDIDSDKVDAILNELGNIDALMEAMTQASTGFGAPKANTVYVFSNEFNLPSGEYKKGSLYYKGNGVYYKLNPLVTWGPHLLFYESALGIPNLSWIGIFEENLIFELLVPEGGWETRTPEGIDSSSTKKGNLGILGALTGLAVGGPPGAGIGYLIGSLF